jgi:hypothetical protein
VSYTTADCETCGASTGAPCVGLRYDEVHAMRFLRIEIAFLQSSTPSSSSAQQLLLPPAGGQ